MKNGCSYFCNIALFLLLALVVCFKPMQCFAQQKTNTEPVAENSLVEKISETEIKKYIDDAVSIITPEYKRLITADCLEIEKKARIRIFIKTVAVKDLNEGQIEADGFFSKWIRSIGLDKRGILVYALLPEGTAHGKILLKVGIGLKYLITKEMGEELLNQVILPSNAENNDGKGFLDGVHSIKRILLDELVVNKQKVTYEPKSFDIGEFFWSYKEILMVSVVVLFFLYLVFFVERCPKCGGSLKVTKEVLKEPTNRNLGLQRKIYVCEKCGLTRRKNEPIYPPGRVGLLMRLAGTRRNVRVD